MISVFDYTDYRALLRDLYQQEKRDKPFFSYRYICAKVGFTSAGFFTNIIAGKRNISSDIIFKFAELFKFNKRETEYFETLVLYDQSKQHTHKKFYYEKLLSMRRGKVRELAADQYEYFNKWYYVAVREALNFFDFKGDYRALAKKLRPAITPSEAKEAVVLLERLGLVAKNANGTYSLTDATITTVPHVPLVAVHNFQIATMDLAKQALDRIPREERTISTLTLSLSKETFDAVSEKLALFRREMLDMVKNDQHEVDRVFQFNFQIFPLTDNSDAKA